MCAAQDFVAAGPGEVAGKVRPARSLAHSPQRAAGGEGLGGFGLRML